MAEVRANGGRGGAAGIAALATLAICAGLLLGQPSFAAASEFGADVAARFAPVVEFAKGERNLPASVPWFLNQSTLEWHNDADDCDSDLIRARRPWNLATMAALGDGGFVAGSRDARCRKTGRRFATNEYTRPTDGGRPGGLGHTDGFVLDLRGEGAVRGGIPDTAPGSPASYTGAPVYYESGDLAKPGAAAGDYMYLTYWFFYPYNGGGPFRHEGDWEGMSIIFGQTSPGHYSPVELGLNQHDGTQGIAWKDRRFPRVRPRVFSAKGTHATYDRAFGRLSLHRFDTTGGGPRWETTTRLLPLATEPWTGYCGAWGQVGSLAGSIGHTGATTGPLGPGCVVNGRLIKRAIPDGWGAPVPVGSGLPGIAVVD